MIQVSGKNIEVGEALRSFIENELNSVIVRYIGEPLETQVNVSKNNHLFRTDISVHVSKNFIVHCHGEDIDAYKSASSALEKLDARTKKYKEKLRDRKRRDGDFHTLPVSYFVIDSDKKSEKDDHPLVIAESAKQIPSVAVSEAVMLMDLSDQPVMMFKNVANGEFNVIYKRTDGNIGWIDPTKKL